MQTVPRELIDLAQRAAQLSRPILRRYFRARLDVVRKGDESPVTRADREAEAAIRSLLAREVPDHGLIGEEHGSERADADYVWVVDPLDGTRAFVVGKPTFGTLIALAHKGRPILGLIDMPMLDEQWIGAAGHRTTWNGEPAETRACERLADAWINTTTPEMFQGAQMQGFERVRDASAGCNYGGDCYGYGLVASGFVDLTIEASMQTYDFMALVPVVEGAGGRITDWSGKPLGLDGDGTVLAAGDARVHAEAVALLTRDRA
ncbi:MAG: histidinol-phosphatase [Alphaproteobacteria bacterium]|nr:histidinol-phosphatase [Alphaproteobacteria bacterium]MCB9930502.1 histidinol-phosphatase [Alphaproteobacteria bacterium]